MVSLDSTLLISTRFLRDQLDSTRLDSTRLDSTRLEGENRRNAYTCFTKRLIKP
jgi:hypothetical protein